VPCGHTYCIECLNKITNCPSCRIQFQNKIPNWEILAIKRSKSSTAPPASVPRSYSPAAVPSSPFQSNYLPAPSTSASVPRSYLPAAAPSSPSISSYRFFYRLLEILDDKCYDLWRDDFLAIFLYPGTILLMTTLFLMSFAFVLVGALYPNDSLIKPFNHLFKINSMVSTWMLIYGSVSIVELVTVTLFWFNYICKR